MADLTVANWLHDPYGTRALQRVDELRPHVPIARGTEATASTPASSTPAIGAVTLATAMRAVPNAGGWTVDTTSNTAPTTAPATAST